MLHPFHALKNKNKILPPLHLKIKLKWRNNASNPYNKTKNDEALHPD